MFIRFKSFSWVAAVLLLASCASRPTASIAPPPGALPCFPGAYYRKAVSSTDVWTGIEGIITLPAITFDESRFDTQRMRHLDNPSIYMGGRAGIEQEIDAGVTWSPVKEPDGTISKLAKAYSPFWRNDDGWHNAPAEPAYYYYPGDTLYMRTEILARGIMELEVSILSRGKNAPADAPINSTFKMQFVAEEFAPGTAQQFKRVNAIDQFGREEKDADPTNTRVEGALWEEVNLLRGDRRIPFTTRHFTDMRCPDAKYFHLQAGGFHNLSGEGININGAGY